MPKALIETIEEWIAKTRRAAHPISDKTVILPNLIMAKISALTFWQDFEDAGISREVFMNLSGADHGFHTARCLFLARVNR
jgi:hypothetical protein